MSEKLYVVPKSGYVIRDPRTMQQVPPDGAFVRDEPYWRRAIAAGDVTIARPPKPAKKAEVKES